MGMARDFLVSTLAASVIDFELVFVCKGWASVPDSSLEVVNTGDVGVDACTFDEEIISGISEREVAFSSVDFSECEDNDFSCLVSTSDDFSTFRCLCVEVVGAFGWLYICRAAVLSSEVRENVLFKFEDSLGARLLVEVEEAPVSRRPLGFAVVI